MKLLYIPFLFFTILNGTAQQTTDRWQCLPCGYDCDQNVFDGPGKCASCGMDLVRQSTIRFKTIQPVDLCDYLQKNRDVVLLDVRTPEEFTGKADPDFGTLKGAINVPVQELEARLASLSHLKGREIIVFCSHSHRSPRASYMLNQNGFNHVTNLAGGMSMMTDRRCMQ
ncbi:MAG: rhodanese-like domain-containing protein [Cyclobacteriaceae bacterium]|nr:rhodanese-like domain-containing protein [Cyclobacteriaceae bacterium]